MGESVQRNSSKVYNEYLLQPVQLLSANMVQESSQNEKSELVFVRSSLTLVPPIEKAELVLIREPLFKLPKDEEAVLMLSSMSGTFEMDEDRVEPLTGELRIDDMSTVMNSSLTVSLSGSCAAFEEFEKINFGLADSALSQDDNVSTFNNNYNEPFEALDVTAYSLPSSGGMRVSADDVIPDDPAKESAAQVLKMPEQHNESGELQPQSFLVFNSLCDSPLSVDSELDVDSEMAVADPGDYSMAVYLEHHPGHFDFPEGAFLCFLFARKLSAEYWDKVFIP